MSLDMLMEQLKKNSEESYQRRAEAEQSLAKAAGAFAMKAAQESMATAPPSSGGGSKGGGGSTSTASAYTGPGGTVSSKGVDPNASMRTMNFRGMSYQVNSSVANRFQGFLKALAKQGYVPKSIGGYANRNIAGTSTKSLHSYGLAIDIDPGSNPVTYGYVKTTLPKGVGKLARRYGLEWGGNWNGSKKDTMHFSVPYFGTK